MMRMLQASSPGYDPTLGFSPFKAIKKVGKGAVKLTTGAAKAGVRAAVAPAVFVKDVATGKNVVQSAGKLVKTTVLSPIQATILDPLNATILAPVKRKVDLLTSRRALKLASDKRGKGARPTAAEHNEARSWTRRTLLKKAPIGPLLAVLAGAEPDTMLLGTSLGAAPVALVAVIPPALVLLNTLIKQMGSKGGAAPAPDAGNAPGAPGADAATQAIQQYQQVYQQAAAIPQAAQQAEQAEPMQVPVDATQPAVDLPAEEPVAGYYFGAPEMTTGKKIGFAVGLLALIGAGVYAAR